jgi:hypothetical protein
MTMIVMVMMMMMMTVVVMVVVVVVALYGPFLCSIHATCPAHLIILCFIVQMLFVEQYET